MIFYIIIYIFIIQEKKYFITKFSGYGIGAGISISAAINYGRVTGIDYASEIAGTRYKAGMQITASGFSFNFNALFGGKKQKGAGFSGGVGLGVGESGSVVVGKTETTVYSNLKDFSIALGKETIKVERLKKIIKFVKDRFGGTK